MYYLLFGFLYLFSLLPFFILYLVSDFVYVLLYYIIGYRRKVVEGNIALAFPEKSVSERTRIAKQFYKNFVDTFIETIKLISLSDAEFDRRCKGDFSQVNAIAENGGNVLFLAIHQFNWEYVNLFLGRNMKIPFLGVYAKIENKAVNKIFYDIRAKYGSILIANTAFQRQIVEWLRKQYAICLAADQATAPEKGYWLNLFGRPAPFVTGPHKTSAKSKPAVVYIKMVKLKRGFYELIPCEVVTNADEYTPETFALKYRDYIEALIREQPANYLWSHRRWKHTFSEANEKQWVDKEPPGKHEKLSF
ncbi:MAG: lipid A biosynthesis acyltransferase [Bacteroidota bacterium]